MPMPLIAGDTFTDTSVNWASKPGFELVIPEAAEPAKEAPATATPDDLKAMGWKAAKAYALEHYGVRARGWSELIREYTMLRG